MWQMSRKNSLHYIGSQDNNNFSFFPIGLGCSAVGKVTG